MLGIYRQRVNQQLDAYLPSVEEIPQRLHQAMRYTVLKGGKRLRASLVYATGQALAIPIQKLDPLACAIELMHAYTLIHDDLPAMDNDITRRGQPACHIAFDEATALLAGNALQSLAYQVLTQAPCKPEKCLNMVRYLSRAVGSKGVIGGQLLDLTIAQSNASYSTLTTIYHLKTSALMEASVQLAIIASTDPCPPNLYTALTYYANQLGLLFQIQDDILDQNMPNSDADKTGTCDTKAMQDKNINAVSLLGLDQATDKVKTLYQDIRETLKTVNLQDSTLAEIANTVYALNYHTPAVTN